MTAAAAAAAAPSFRSLLSGRAYASFNREERNCVAMLYHVLLMEGNLQRFIDRLGWAGTVDWSTWEMAVEWSLLRDEWALLSDKEDQPKRRRLIEVALGLAEKDGGGAAKGLQEFNCFYGARPRPSVEYIQSPATWHLADLTVSLPQDQEFVAACKLKWAFRIKPDLVITAGNRVLCIEAKWESAESRYPTAASERRVFKERGLPETVVSQTELQRYLLSDLLGFDTHFVFLTKATSLGPESLTWRQAFSGLDLDTAGVPAFIYKWVDALD